jgi:hypothetical protein
MHTNNQSRKSGPCVGIKTTLHSLSRMEALSYAGGITDFPVFRKMEWRASPKTPIFNRV